jgi:Leucine-rich repeat (LRR) protein
MSRVKPIFARRLSAAAWALLFAVIATVAASRLVAQESASTSDPKPAGNAASQAAADSAAPPALARLKGLGAIATTSRHVGLWRGWRGTAADLKLLDDLADFQMLYFDADAIGVESIAGLHLTRPIKHLVPQILSDADVARLTRLPRCVRLSLVNDTLTANGYRRLAELADGVESLGVQHAWQGIRDDELEFIGKIRSLHELSVWPVSVTDVGLSHLAGLDNLEVLRLSDFRDTPDFNKQGRRDKLSDCSGLASLAPIKLLRRLDLQEVPIGAAGFKALAQLNQLETLRLSALRLPPGDEGTPEDVAALKSLSNLRSFEIATSVYWNGEASLEFGYAVLRAAAGMSSLRSLKVHGPCTSGGSLEALAKASHLEELFLDPVTLSDRSLSAIGRMKDLRNLGLGSEGIVTAEVLAKLAAIPQLTQLALSGDSQLTGTDLAALANLKQLKALTLADTPFGDDESEVLRSMPGLEELNLDKTKISDRALESITSLANLHVLRLNDTAVTVDRLLVTLPKLKHLAQLSIVHVDSSDEQLDQLFAALPGLDRVYGPETVAWRGR